jgi:hypothetical protein
VNEAFLRRDTGPLVKIGEKQVKGCIIVTQSAEGAVSLVSDGLSFQEEITALEKALDFAKQKLTWKTPVTEKSVDPNDPNISYETFKFETPEQGQHFAVQVALAGLPISTK